MKSRARYALKSIRKKLSFGWKTRHPLLATKLNKKAYRRLSGESDQHERLLEQVQDVDGNPEGTASEKPDLKADEKPKHTTKTKPQPTPKGPAEEKPKPTNKEMPQKAAISSRKPVIPDRWKPIVESAMPHLLVSMPPYYYSEPARRERLKARCTRYFYNIAQDLSQNRDTEMRPVPANSSKEVDEILRNISRNGPKQTFSLPIITLTDPALGQPRVLFAPWRDPITREPVFSVIAIPGLDVKNSATRTSIRTARQLPSLPGEFYVTSPHATNKAKKYKSAAGSQVHPTEFDIDKTVRMVRYLGFQAIHSYNLLVYQPDVLLRYCASVLDIATEIIKYCQSSADPSETAKGTTFGLVYKTDLKDDTASKTEGSIGLKGTAEAGADSAAQSVTGAQSHAGVDQSSRQIAPKNSDQIDAVSTPQEPKAQAGTQTEAGAAKAMAQTKRVHRGAEVTQKKIHISLAFVGGAIAVLEVLVQRARRRLGRYIPKDYESQIAQNPNMSLSERKKIADQNVDRGRYKLMFLTSHERAALRREDQISAEGSENIHLLPAIYSLDCLLFYRTCLLVVAARMSFPEEFQVPPL